MSKVLVVAVSLIIVFINSDNMVGLALLGLNVDLSDALFMVVKLECQHLVSNFLLFQDEVELSFAAVKALEKLDRRWVIRVGCRGRAYHVVVVDTRCRSLLCVLLHLRHSVAVLAIHIGSILIVS